MKSIYLDVAGRMHSLYQELVSHPPPGYQFVTQGTRWDTAVRAASKLNGIYTFQEMILSKAIPVNLAKAYLERFKKPPEGTALTYATGHVVFRKEPWVVDLEFVTQLAGYSISHFCRYRRLIERLLTSEYCKKIICWTEAGKKTVLLNMNCEDFVDKVEVVPLAVPRKKFVKEYSKKRKVKLLFVGSANIPGEFEYKGGKEVLEAFVTLRQKYPDLELVIRSDIPAKIKARYNGLSDLKIIDSIIPWEQLEEEFKSADVFLFPSHATPGLAILDAMSYELPVITTDVWANPEMVTDGKTGFVISKSEQVPYYTDNFIPLWDYRTGSRFMRAIETTDPKIVEEMVAKTSLLVENKELRRKMGRAGREAVEDGRFSPEKRNEQLKRIFDEATTN